MTKAWEMVKWAREAIAGSRWAGLVGKAAAYLAGFVLLAAIGSGWLSSWFSPPAKLGIAVAEARTAAPVASAPPIAIAPDAGAAGEDAGASPSEAQKDAGAAGVDAEGKVILNLATEDDLRRLPGIGPTRARAILALRGRMKRFGRVEDLLKVKGLGRRSLARLRPLVRVD